MKSPPLHAGDLTCLVSSLRLAKMATCLPNSVDTRLSQFERRVSRQPHVACRYVNWADSKLVLIAEVRISH
jgi:hypothetical protein